MLASEYELIVKKVIDKIDSSLIKVLGVGNTHRMTGASVYKHQIDISYNDLKRNKLILIECKMWGKKIDIGPVLTFHARILDISENTKIAADGIMVTTIGFSKSAERYADYYGIKLQIVKNEYQFKVFLEEMFYIGIKDKAHFPDTIDVKKENLTS